METARVKLTTARVGQGFSQSPGHELDLPIREAYRLTDSGQAYFVGAPPPRPVVVTEPAGEAAAAPAETPVAEQPVAETAATASEPANEQPPAADESAAVETKSRKKF